MGVPLFSDAFLSAQANKLIQSPMTVVRGLDEHDWALLKPAEVTAQLEAALHTQAAAGTIEACGLDLKSTEARGIILEALTRSLSPFAQQCIYDLDSQILSRATRFSESYDAGVLTIRVFRRSPDSHPPTEDQIGVCHARFDEEDNERCDPDLHHGDLDDDDMPELVYPAPISVYDPDLLPLSHARTSTAHLPPPFSPAQATNDPATNPTTSTPDFMSPSAGVFHAHTLDLPLEAPPPAARRASPPNVPAFPSYPTVTLAPPPMRAFYNRSASPASRASAPSGTTAHTTPPARRGLGQGWAEEARRLAAQRTQPDARQSGTGLIADEALVHIAHEVFNAQASGGRHESSAGGGAGAGQEQTGQEEVEYDPEMPPLELAVPTAQRAAVERREELRRMQREREVRPLEWRGRFGREEEVQSEES